MDKLVTLRENKEIRTWVLHIFVSQSRDEAQNQPSPGRPAKQAADATTGS